MKAFIASTILASVIAVFCAWAGMPNILAGGIGVGLLVAMLPVCMVYVRKQAARSKSVKWVRLGGPLSRGFGLVELMIVIVVASVIVFGTIQRIGVANEHTTRDRLVREAADRYHVVYNAVSQWVGENRDAWEVDVLVSVGGAGLISQGFLDPSFAPNEDGDAYGYTPWNTNIRAFAIKDDEDHVRVVITERNDIDLGTARKMGIELDNENRAQQSNALARDVALSVTSLHHHVAGYIPANDRFAIGLENRFTFDVTPWESTPRDTGRVVVLWGFPEYGVTDGTGPVSTNPFDFVNRECDLYPASYQRVGSGYDWVDGVCPASLDEEGRIPVCERAGHSSGISAIIGFATHGRRTDVWPANTSQNCQAQGCQGKENRTTYGSFALGVQQVWEDVCFASEWQNRPVWDPDAPVLEWVIRPFPDSASVSHAYCCRDAPSD